MVGARVKQGKGGGGVLLGNSVRWQTELLIGAPFNSPHFALSSGSFNMTLSRANCAPKENACTAGYMNDDKQHEGGLKLRQ